MVQLSPHWIPTRSEGLRRIAQFVPSAGTDYARLRNFDTGPIDRSNVSVLSPWIRHRLLLEQDILSATLEQHSAKAAESFISEVFWRSYFKGWLEHRPRVWRDYRHDLASLEDQLGSSNQLSTRHEAAVSGNTGIDCFDAWLTELLETNYLHNHARMWFASIWVFTLRLPWQLGADLFLRHLLDGDPASNTLSWRWVAGLHTKGKHYLARRANIEKFTEGRFSPSGLAEDALARNDSREYPVMRLPPVANDPISGPVGLLITAEDCAPESLPLASQPVSVAGMVSTERRSQRTVAPKVLDFAQGAVADALSRAAAAFGCDRTEVLRDDLASALIQWAERNNFRTIVTAYAPVGQVRDALSDVESVLGRAGVEIQQIKRRYDELTWPHATKGFFRLKKKIPKFLAEVAA